MKITALTDVGKMRANNEDVYSVLEDARVYIVCDGMGGHQAGEIAAQAATEDITAAIAEIETLTADNFSDAIRSVLVNVNAKIMAMAAENEAYRNMGTTLVLAALSEPYLLVANVGDSRCYIVKDGKLVQVSKDHSLVAELVKIGSISEAEAEKHPDRNIITSAIGVDESFEVFTDVVPLDGVSHILLCTDGLTNMLNPKRILALLTEPPFEEAANALVNEANDSGGQDNITVVCIEL
ncbi:Stp1/IreP family PP2C-type Ser/Thr phosphatase [Fusibacter paucivorans]|uniref:Stp1/IreP family PP2C-type Ser/Thr phosphatase n=1 Tax=Fusibacter paucivorans TaxID=76009 RepID=A0ABS5PQL0_9FIRM|nr:Stp1/IreP family PP2C-type Ser/Thr phosphatase [Fusibacter paucivorans]MBS7527435.1 Stp1/IreP family PP2C-type Ser/Thr phosphatase [Fusibacter paucivorans]